MKIIYEDIETETKIVSYDDADKDYGLIEIEMSCYEMSFDEFKQFVDFLQDVKDRLVLEHLKKPTKK